MSLLQAAENRAQFKAESKLPATSADSPLGWLTDFFGGSKTASGMKVSVDNAISLSTVFMARALISEDMAGLPFGPKITEEIEESGKKRTNTRTYREHYSYNLLANRPHPLISSFNFRKVMFAWATTYDDAYAIIERNGNAQPRSMFPIHPKRVNPEVKNNRLKYVIDGELELDPMSVFHIVGNTDNGLKGKSRIQIGKEGIGKALAAQKFGADFFGKGINVSGFIEHPDWFNKDKDKIERLKSSFVKKYGGQNGQFGVGVIEGGGKWKKNETNPEEAQLNETEKVDARFVANLLKMPVTMLNQLERGTYNNIEQLTIQYVNHTLIPWGRNWEQECWFKLLSEREKAAGTINFKFNFNGLLRGDMEARAKFYESMSKVAAYSPNRILDLEDENGYRDGDIHLVMPGATTVESLLKQEENEE